MAKEVILTGPNVIKLVAHYMSEEHVAFVQKALDYATEAHKEQFRKSGEPYIIHPIKLRGSWQNCRWILIPLQLVCMMSSKIPM